MTGIASVAFSAGQLIFKEDQPGDVMYMVKAGLVELLIKSQLLEEVGPGGIIGEMVLLDRQLRSATGIAKTDCALMPIDQPQFYSMVRQTPSFAIRVMQVMCERLRRTDQIAYAQGGR
ncbi:MAG: cyclic nucleotide-binding domain-containing protein [Limisphaerales bacterium]